MSVKERLDAHTIVLGNVIQSEPCSHQYILNYNRFRIRNYTGRARTLIFVRNLPLYMIKIIHRSTLFFIIYENNVSVNA